MKLIKCVLCKGQLSFLEKKKKKLPQILREQHLHCYFAGVILQFWPAITTMECKTRDYPKNIHLPAAFLQEMANVKLCSKEHLVMGLRIKLVWQLKTVVEENIHVLISSVMITHPSKNKKRASVEGKRLI